MDNHPLNSFQNPTGLAPRVEQGRLVPAAIVQVQKAVAMAGGAGVGTYIIGSVLSKNALWPVAAFTAALHHSREVGGALYIGMALVTFVVGILFVIPLFKLLTGLFVEPEIPSRPAHPPGGIYAVDFTETKETPFGDAALITRERLQEKLNENRKTAANARPKFNE